VELVSSDIPAVTIDHLFNNRTCIQSENRQGMQELVRYVYGRGHRSIAYVHGSRSAVTEIRVTSFLRTMSDLGLTVPDGFLQQAMYHDPAVAYQVVRRMLAAPRRPSCILMPDDYAALGGIEAADEAGLRISGGSVHRGVRRIRMIQRLTPRLTTIAQDTVRIGQEAARQLVHLIERPAHDLSGDHLHPHPADPGRNGARSEPMTSRRVHPKTGSRASPVGSLTAEMFSPQEETRVRREGCRIRLEGTVSPTYPYKAGRRYLWAFRGILSGERPCPPTRSRARIRKTARA
jgi:hypothetical protein